MSNVVPKSIQELRNAWKKVAIRVSSLHVFIGITNLAVSAIAAALAGLSSVDSTYAVIAAFCAGFGSFLAGVLTFKDFNREGSKRWLAWKVLEIECLDFESRSRLTGQDLIDARKRLIDAIRLGEKILGDPVEHSIRAENLLDNSEPPGT